MNTTLLGGLALVLLGGILQGSFILPMTLTRRWQWEHGWLMFSLIGMLVLNWAIGATLMPCLVRAYRATPLGDLAMLACFGLLWGLGAVLFGLGMARLGMAVGYPIIMGLILSLGALIPVLLKSPADLAAPAGLLTLLGMAITIAGIVVCARAVAAKDAAGGKSSPADALGVGLTIAVLAGVFSAFPNVGFNYAQRLREAAMNLGTSAAMATNAAWVLLFTAGFTLNFGYCLLRIAQRKNLRELGHHFFSNTGWIALMSVMWIGSFYLYGLGAARMDAANPGTAWGGIVGWPLFLSLSIIVGNLWGLWRGEWRDANSAACRGLRAGLLVLLASVATFGLAAYVGAAAKPADSAAVAQPAGATAAGKAFRFEPWQNIIPWGSTIGFRCVVDLEEAK